MTLLFVFLRRALLQATVAMTPIAGGLGIGMDFHDVRGQLPKTKEWPQRSLDRITGQVWHHTASPQQALKNMAQFHISSRGWPTLSYHYVVDSDGTVFWVNDIHDNTYHTAGANTPNIGIAIMGNLERLDMTDAQKHSTDRLIHYLSETYRAKRVTFHSMHKATACPGKFGKEFLKSRVLP